jgi:hypothetical protein
LTGDVSVASLTIQPGVTVLATGDYIFDIVGVLNAAGTAQAPITFTVSPCNMNGWEGIRFNSAQAGVFTHVSVEGSIAGGVRIVSSSPTLLNCVIHDNSSGQGGGVFVQGSASNVIIRNCIVTGNTADDFFEAGGGLFVRDGASVSVQASIIQSNFTVYANALGGGIFVCGGAVSVTNTVIYQNGGSLYGNGSGAVAVDTGGLSNCSSNATIDVEDSILFGDVPFELSGSGITVSYSDIQGGYAGTGNIAANPIFADTSFHLLDGASPAVDAGDPVASTNDLCLPPSLGTSRNDMGCYGGPWACGW